MPRFEPFRALRYATRDGDDISDRTSPPYDVFGVEARQAYAQGHPHNIVLVDYPVEQTGADRYRTAASVLRDWVSAGILVREEQPSFYLYRMEFVDDSGRQRRTSAVVGALEVVDEGAPGVLPHERTTPKDKTDRLDLTRATETNLSPVWGLSLTSGLSELLSAEGTVVAVSSDESGVRHVLERVDDRGRIDQISRAVASSPVLIADGHHRYAVSRTYRDEVRSSGGPAGAELTMTFVQELVEEQLSIAAIHRLFDETPDELSEILEDSYELIPGGKVGPETVGQMADRGCLCLVDGSGVGTFLMPRERAFEGVRNVDSVRLEHAVEGRVGSVRYQHGVDEVLRKLADGSARSAVLIRPVSIDEIRRTATTGELMPPKSTFFTPKIRTGMVMRPLGEDA